MHRTLMRSAMARAADRRGVAAAEYAVLAVGLALVLGTIPTSLGPSLLTVFASALFGVPPTAAP